MNIYNICVYVQKFYVHGHVRRYHIYTISLVLILFIDMINRLGYEIDFKFRVKFKIGYLNKPLTNQKIEN